MSIFSVVFLYFIFYLVGIGCPIKFLTGVSCLACGMTRALRAVLRLDFASAFHYHPLWMVPEIWLISYIFRKKHPQIYKLVCLVAILLFILVYTLRMALGTDDIVVFRPSEGFVFRSLENIMYHR
ncbi:MAG: DUF2752 domain-containing protein [Lachnospiraceae bacterium]|nr:DUF2752 domain-containing protein [Lachnospiraceae bacterium]